MRPVGMLGQERSDISWKIDGDRKALARKGRERVKQSDVCTIPFRIAAPGFEFFRPPTDCPLAKRDLSWEGTV